MKNKLFIKVVGNKGGKKGGDQPRKPVEQPDTLFSNTTAYILEALSEGEIKGPWNPSNPLENVYFENTPVKNEDGSFNYEGVTSEFRAGIWDQQPIPGFEKNLQNYPRSQGGDTLLSGVTQSVEHPDPLEGVFQHVIRINTALNQLYKVDSNSGDVVGLVVKFIIKIETYNDSGFANLDEVVVNDFEISLSGKTLSVYNYSQAFTLDDKGGKWVKIYITRVTPDFDAINKFGQLYWTSYDISSTINGGGIRYNDTALVGHIISQQEYGDSIVKRNYEIDGILCEIPSNYYTDPDTPLERYYEGIWDGTFKLGWTDNPAWIVRDLLVNDRYGLGRFLNIEEVDKWTLYTISQYNDAVVAGQVGTADEGNFVITDFGGTVVGGVPDGKGGKEPRYTCNIKIGDRRAAYEVINQISSIFHGLSYWSSGTVMFTQDAPRDIDLVVNRTNVVEGSFNYEGTSFKNRHSVVNVTYTDPDKQYQPNTLTIQDPELLSRVGYKTLDTVAIGCTSKGQALRWAKWILDNERYANQLVTYKAGWDHSYIRPGDIVGINDPKHAAERIGGRITGIVPRKPGNPDIFTMDQEIEYVVGETYEALFTLPDGVINESLMPITGITQSNPVSITVVNHSITNGQEVKIDDVNTMTEINGIVAEATVIDADTIRLDSVDSSLFSPYLSGGYVYPTATTSKYTNIDIIRGEVTNPATTTNVTSNLIYAPVSEFGFSTGEYPLLGSVFGLTRLQSNIRQFRVLSNTPAENNTFDITGLLHDPNKYDRTDKYLTPPSDIQSKESLYLAGATAKSKVDISWTPSLDPRTTYYEIQIQDPFDDIPQGTWKSLSPTRQISTQIQDTSAGTYYFRIRARDNLFHASEWVESGPIFLNILATPPQDVSNFEAHITGESMELTWDRVTDLDLSRYELRFSTNSGATWNEAQTINSSISKDTVRITLTGRDGSYFIKAYDQLGNASVNATKITTTMNSIFDYNLTKTQTEETSFSGTKTNTVVVSNTLRLDLPGDFISAWPSLSIIPTLTSGYSGYISSGIYEVNQTESSGDAVFDLGNVYESRVYYDMTASIDLLGDTLNTWPILQNQGRLDNSGDIDVTDIIVQVSTTEDNPSSSPTWSSWQNLIMNNYRARAFRFRILLSTTDKWRSPVIENLSFTIDMPDRIITNAEQLTTVASSPGYSVDFTSTSDNSPSGQPFYGPTKPSIGITLHDPASGDYADVTYSSISTTGFNITIRDSAGNPKIGEFDYIAKGYGAKKA
jgi:predicted phage tail protein